MPNFAQFVGKKTTAPNGGFGLFCPRVETRGLFSLKQYTGAQAEKNQIGGVPWVSTTANDTFPNIEG